MDPIKKEEEPKPQLTTKASTWKYCKLIAILALICAVALIAYVVFAPSSPKNMMGGKKKGWKSRGGCGCVAAPQT
jgi:hypothetical protein